MTHDYEAAYLETNDKGFVYLVVGGKRIASLFGDLETKHENGNRIINSMSLAAKVTGEPSEGMVKECIDAEFGIDAKHLSYREIFKAMIAAAQREI